MGSAHLPLTYICLYSLPRVKVLLMHLFWSPSFLCAVSLLIFCSWLTLNPLGSCHFCSAAFYADAEQCCNLAWSPDSKPQTIFSHLLSHSHQSNLCAMVEKRKPCVCVTKISLSICIAKQQNVTFRIKKEKGLSTYSIYLAFSHNVMAALLV